MFIFIQKQFCKVHKNRAFLLFLVIFFGLSWRISLSAQNQVQNTININLTITEDLSSSQSSFSQSSSSRSNLPFSQSSSQSSRSSASSSSVKLSSSSFSSLTSSSISSLVSYSSLTSSQSSSSVKSVNMIIYLDTTIRTGGGFWLIPILVISIVLVILWHSRRKNFKVQAVDFQAVDSKPKKSKGRPRKQV